MSIITYPLNGIEYSATDAETYLCTRKSGVFSSDISITPNGLGVTVGSFLAWISNSEFSGKSVAITSPVILQFETPDALFSRIDRVVLRFNSNANESNLIVLKGIASSSPAPQNISRSESMYDLCLADVTIRAGISEISYADIKSQILNEELCGIMSDSVTSIPTSVLEANFNELLEKLNDELQSTKDGSAYMLTSVYDADGKMKQVAFADEVPKISYGTSNPSGGSNGDIYIKYQA